MSIHESQTSVISLCEIAEQDGEQGVTATPVRLSRAAAIEERKVRRASRTSGLGNQAL
jgi:hypothetical protein